MSNIIPGAPTRPAQRAQPSANDNEQEVLIDEDLNVTVQDRTIKSRFPTDADFLAWCDEVDAHIARVRKRVAGV